MINDINISNVGFDSPIVIRPENLSSQSNNWVTVLIGENGTKKSFLLRILTEAGLGKSRFRLGSSRRYVALSLSSSDTPSRIIAVSGTPLDRFPRSGLTNISIGKKRRINIDEPFVYLGQRAVNGMAGVGQSERSLIGSLLSNRSKLRSRRQALELVFSHLGLRARVEVKLKLSSSRDSLSSKLAKEGTLRTFKKALLEDLSALSEKFRAEGGAIGPIKHTDDLIQRLNDKDELTRIKDILASFSTPRFGFSLAPVRSGAKPDTFSLDDWEIFLSLGIVEVDGTQFFRLKNISGSAINSARSQIQGHELSSGQWGWLTGFAGLAVELRPNSLVLVDEPENSLHPSWQRDYVPTVEKLISAFDTVQVIIATHSPLVASGVNPLTGNVRHLTKTYNRELETDVVTSQEQAPTYGWTANDVYKSMFDINSTRAESFTSLANQALKAIKNKERLSSQEYKIFVEHIQDSAESLPQFDPLRMVFSDIVASLKKLERV